jgi:hypothetical protein
MRRNVLCGSPGGGGFKSEPAGTERTKIAKFSISNVAQTPCAGWYFAYARSTGEIDAIFERVNMQPLE